MCITYYSSHGTHIKNLSVCVSVCVFQEVCVWEWTLESEQPLCQTTLSTDYGRQYTLTFHPSDPSQLVSNSEDTVVFYHWVSFRQ